MLSRLALRDAQKLSVAIRGLQATSSTASNSDANRSVFRAEFSPVRHAFIPESWFTNFYPKTGVTGPYVFFGTFSTYLVSKEIFIIGHQFMRFWALLAIVLIIKRSYGDKIVKYMRRAEDEYIGMWEGHRQNRIDLAQKQIDICKKAILSAEGQNLLLEAKRENIKIQLEAVYRERIAHVYNEVKRRLDYSAQLEAVERRLAQKHMVEWIINNVLKAITPELEKAALQQCIRDLEALAPRA